MEHMFPYPKMGTSFLEVLEDPLTRKILGFDAHYLDKMPFINAVSSRLTFLLHDASQHLSFLKIGYTALEAFLQANCTGPPLDFKPEDSIFPDIYKDDIPMLKQEMLRTLAVDGDDVYSLTPHIELFWLARLVMGNAAMAEEGFNGRRARLRVNFWHQKLLSEKSDTLRDELYQDAEVLEQQLASRLAFHSAAAEEHFVEFLLERATIRTYYGDDSKAREDLVRAAVIRKFQYALTGALGKRTKFQQHDISQLVVLAKSRDDEPDVAQGSRRSSRQGRESRSSNHAEQDGATSHTYSGHHMTPRSPVLTHRPATPTSPLSGEHRLDYWRSKSPVATTRKPENLPLNDDTLLEHIQFTQPPTAEPNPTAISDVSSLPPQLAELDPSSQPLLFPIDSIILLATASSISNTSPADGLTREETLPYATRVLEGGSSNWQVYTQALLVRSRIEGYRSRTTERGLLQLQALVDQVIAETTPDATSIAQPDGESGDMAAAPNTFLPKPKADESASVAERLKFIHQLATPLRWELEAELAARWTQLGGLKTALDIYERLQMHAEVALCLAATDREAEAIKVLKDMLFDRTAQDASSMEPIYSSSEAPTQDAAESSNTVPSTTLTLKSPPPADAPRLLCILADITTTPSYYTLAWEVSSRRYARAQRSLGRYLVKQRSYPAAIQAYSLALSVSRLDLPTWFALGCTQLELEDYAGAVESFTRCVQLEDKDAEAWSNLAVALLRLPAPESTTPPTSGVSADEEINHSVFQPVIDPYKHIQEALRALRRAANLKREDARIWDNYLTVAASIPPSAGTPWNEIMQAMQRVIELRGKKEGENCIDLSILPVVVDYITTEFEFPLSHDQADVKDKADGEASRPRLPFLVRALLHLVDTHIIPLATSSVPLYTLLARVSLFRQRPAESLQFHEKAWRAVTSSPGVYEAENGWKEVVTRTKQLVNAYRDLGEKERERTGGMVEKGWKFKSRSAVRSVLGKGRGTWEETEGWKELEACMEDLKS